MAGISERQLLSQLRETVGLLAAPAAEQERWLANQRYPVDELGLQLSDAVPMWLPRLSKAGLLTDNARQALKQLDDALGTFSGPENAALWTEEALYNADQWQHVRDLARHAFTELGKGGTSA